MGHTSAQVVTVEGCPNTSEKARGLFDVFNLKNIQLNNETFEDFFRNNTTETYDLVYIDGNHNKERTLAYFEFLLNKTHNNSVFVFDDIYWSKAMSQAWETIIAHPKVTVSIDTFQWGLVFFRKEQQKEHFRIKV
jgi:predicted O-methyltransferase YrrM